MALTPIQFPALGASNWTSFKDLIADLIIGHISVSLSNMDNNNAPVVKAGSKVEVGGTYFEAQTDQTPSGTLTSNALNYIYIDASDYNVKWTSTAPTWIEEKQGWYNGNNRYIGGCYYDGTNYTNKWVYGIIKGISLDHIHDGKTYRRLPIITSKVNAYRSSAQTLPNGTYTVIQYNAEDNDEYDEWNNTTNYNFIPKEDGFYYVTASAAVLFGAADKKLVILIYKTGTAVAKNDKDTSSSTDTAEVFVSRFLYLTTSDNIQVKAYQASGSDQNIMPGREFTYINIFRVL